MDLTLMMLIAGCGTVIGLLIGCVGIGGVLLVPILAFVVGIDLHVAISAAMLSYLFSGAAAALVYERRGSIRHDMSGWLWLGAIPAAFAGAALSWSTPGHVLEIVIALMVLFAGIRSLRPRPHGGDASRTPHGIGLTAIGGLTGFGSALTGTGGPLILVPILTAIEVPMLSAVGLSQAIQIPIAALATAGNLFYGQIDLVVAGIIAATLTIGTTVGAQFAHSVSQPLVRRMVALVMFAVGIYILAHIVRGW